MKPFDGIRAILWPSGPGELARVEHTLVEAGCRTETVRTLDEVWQELESGLPDFIVAELRPGFHEPLRLLSREAARAECPPVLIVSATLEVPTYLAAMEMGAYDCLALPVPEKELLRVAAAAVGSQHNSLVHAGGKR